MSDAGEPPRPLDSLALTGKIADIANKIIVSLAIVVGGGWALYKFEISESPTAQLDLDRIKRICAERGSLDIRIDATHKGKILFGKVVVKNIGTREVSLDMRQEAPIYVAELNFTSDGDTKASNIIKAGFPYVFEGHPDHRLTFFSILPGRTTELHFATSLAHSGTYLISFNGGPRHVSPDAAVCGTTLDNNEYVWGASAIQQIQVTQ
jgi:hypothetical protein